MLKHCSCAFAFLRPVRDITEADESVEWWLGWVSSEIAQCPLFAGGDGLLDTVVRKEDYCT